MTADPTARRATMQENLQRQIIQLSDRMDKGFEEIKRILGNVEERIRCLERNDDGYQPLLTARVDVNNKKLDDHEKLIQRHTDLITAINLDIAGLKKTNAILSWLGGIMGSGIIIWLLGQFLGLIQ